MTYRMAVLVALLALLQLFYNNSNFMHAVHVGYVFWRALVIFVLNFF